MLWEQRNSIINELSRLRINKLRPNLEYEAENLVAEIYKKAQRLLPLAALLDGQNVLRLDLNKLLIRHNQEYKNDLINAVKALDDSFQKLTKVDF